MTESMTRWEADRELASNPLGWLPADDTDDDDWADAVREANRQELTDSSDETEGWEPF